MNTTDPAKSKMTIKFLECPTCGAKENDPCRTPKGRKKDSVHDTRPFYIG